jgi:hypothetical protein
VFEEAAVELVWRQTQGQPWLVNAVAREVVAKMLRFDYSRVITAELVAEAVHTIILRRDTHIDSLLERLKEERVRKIIEPIIIGKKLFDRESDDFQYVMDLGLISYRKEELVLANPIYTEVIARTLTQSMQRQLVEDTDTYPAPHYMRGGRIDMDFLLRDFQQFWRENSDVWVTKFDYEEAAPHLVLMAFLQRVVNGEGQLIWEMAAGRGCLDICLVYEGVTYPVELRFWKGEKSLEGGVEQTLRYMDVYGASEGWLALFDRTAGASWDERIYMEKRTVDGKTVTVVGL